MERRAHPLDKKSSPKAPNVRSASVRKLGKDGGLTPTERVKKNRLMKQFTKKGRKGYEIATSNSEEYRANYELIDWGHK